MYIPRGQENYLSMVIKNSRSPHNVLLIEGARQTGKTTLIRKILNGFPNSLEFNLERNKLLRKDIDRCNSFDDFTLRLRQEGLSVESKQILFIDEAQESEKLGDFVRFMKEEWPNTLSILSGSSMTRLFRPGTRIPVGRIHRFLVQPFSFYEFLSHEAFLPLREQLDSFSLSSPISKFAHEQLLEKLDIYLSTGGLPEVISTYHLEQANFIKVMKEILANQEDDFIQRVGLPSAAAFSSALRGVANHLGGVSTYTHIADSVKEAKSICKHLEAWRLVLEIEQKSFSSTTNLYPKRYVYDIGIAQLLRNQPFAGLSLLKTSNPALRTQIGGIFENLVLLSIKEFELGGTNVTGWKLAPGNTPEVDFVLKTPQRILPIECKATLKVNKRSFSSLKIFLEKTESKLGLLVSAAPFEIFKLNEVTIINIPAYLFRIEILERLLKEV